MQARLFHGMFPPGSESYPWTNRCLRWRLSFYERGKGLVEPCERVQCSYIYIYLPLISPFKDLKAETGLIAAWIHEAVAH